MKNKQLNALGAFKNLELFDSKGNKVYEFLTNSKDYWYKYTYDSKGNELTFENSQGYWRKSTYDSKGNELTYEDSKGNELTYEDSTGVKRGFDIPEFTMEELMEKIGYNFKIIK